MEASAQTHTTVSGHIEPVANDNAHNWTDRTLKQRYRIESLLGSGGMSDVYKATDLHLEEAGARDAQVAVKILRAELTQDSSALSLLAREAAKSKRLSHPNIIRVYDLDHDGDTWFMVMELLEGEPLSKVIQRARPQGLKWPGAAKVLEQIFSAMAYSHARGIVHADLKPSNIFVTSQGSIKILDYGVAQALKPNLHEDFLSDQQSDETTVYGYTPAYASTSLIAGKEPSVCDDLYALACVSFELLSSRHPFDRKKLTEEERRQFKLIKPAHMPLRLWQPVRKLLKEEKPQPTLHRLQQAIKPIPVMAIIYPAALAASLLMALGIWHSDKTAINALQAQLDGVNSHQLNLASINAMPVDDLLAKLPSLSPQEQAGVLRVNRNRIVDHFEQKIDAALKQEDRPDLPNFPAAAVVLKSLLDLYPNDDDVRNLDLRLEQRRQSLISALSDEYKARLDQANYQDAPAIDALANLKADLHFLTPKEVVPSAQAQQKLADNLNGAMAAEDAPAISRLMDVANRFFPASDTLKAPLAKADKLKAAIAKLADYQQQIDNGQHPDYPVAAAEAFYQSKLDGWQQQIADAKDAKALDAVYNDLAAFEKALPAPLPSLKVVRKNLANAYLAKANELLSHRHVVAAQPLMQKANTLMSAG
ncbi:serine/threonine-protein kinase [Gallaecimonas mangrovi]|uniref:serine/threonine-protein kinase n=1 Tax=Gallaecimonas mangrovi TaxID=2291597 RepID=UPI000E1FBE1C|nr:serine/threonine-protein kinase [Gallaecimonas mangrovi]